MRVAFLAADLDVGGIQSMVDSLGRGLDRTRFEPSFVCFDKQGAIAERLRADGYAVRFVPRRPGLDSNLPRALRQTFAELGVELVHAHNRTALFYAVLARGLRAGPKLLYTEHDRSFPEALKVRALHAILSRRLDSVVAVCNAVRNAIVATEGFPAARTHVIVNGVADPGFAAVDPSQRDAIRREFDVGPGQRLVLAIGHLTAVKDHATLLDSLALIPTSERPHLVIAGDGPLRAELEAQRSRLGLDDSVALPGYRKDVPALLNAADLLVMSSVSEGLSIALIEATARGVPIVATDVGGNDEIVEHGKNGLLVPARDPLVLANTLREILPDESRLRAFGRAGRERYERRFRLEQMVESYSAIYASVVGA